MEQYKDVLAKYSFEKSEDALKAGFDNVEINLTVAQNRAYYAIFYAVLALGYLDGFVTGSHHKLMGWFTKKYIFETETFDREMGKIYNKLIRNRETFDYDVTKKPTKEIVLMNLESSKAFVETLKPYIFDKLRQLENKNNPS